VTIHYTLEDTPMARVSTYLNFARSTEAAFLFYRSVFQTEFSAPIARFKDIPPDPNLPPLPDADKIQFVEMVDLDTKGFAAKKKEYQQIFLR